MINSKITLTQSEFRDISTYIVKNLRPKSKIKLVKTDDNVSEFADGFFLRGITCSIDKTSDDVSVFDVFVKHEHNYVSFNNPLERVAFNGRAKFITRNNGKFTSLNLESLSREQRLLIEKIGEKIKERELKSLGHNCMVKFDSFLVECDALLNRFFLIKKDTELNNATADAVFNHCAYRKSKGYKHEHWLKYLNEDLCIRRVPSEIKKNLMQVINRNKTIHNDDLALINSDYLDRDGAMKLTNLIEASLLNTSISLKDDFLTGYQTQQIGEKCEFTGVIFGVSQTPTLQKTEYEIRIKASDGNFVKIVSGSENFGGLISKREIIDLIREQTSVTVCGDVVNKNNGLQICGRSLVPPSISIKANQIKSNQINNDYKNKVSVINKKNVSSKEYSKLSFV